MAAAGEIDVFGKLVAQTVAGKIANAEQIEGLEEMISEAIQPAEKDVVEVMTYAASAPSSPEDGDMYINSSSNKLFVYDEDMGWTEETPDTSVLYLTNDTTHVYAWTGTTFKDVTGEQFIPVRNLTTDLEPYTDKGVYTVRLKNGPILVWYTLVVIGLSSKVTQILSWHDGWKRREKTNSTWGIWETHDYAYKPSSYTSGNFASLDSNGGIEDSGHKHSDYLTQHQDISGKADKVNKVELSTVEESGTATLQPNTYYYNSTARSTNLTVALAPPTDSTIANVYHLRLAIASGSTVTITWPNWQWNGGSAPTITAGKTYEVSILDGVAAFIEVEPLS